MRHTTVTVVEVGPRDGLQNEAAAVATADKVEFVNRLSAAGLTAIEVSAFVSPKWVPQMADADAVFAAIARQPHVRYAALVPNLTGLERAHASGVTEVGIFAAASEGFSRRNINQGIEQSLDTYRGVCARAAELGIRVRGYVSTAFGCPLDGAVPPRRVGEVAAALVNMGAFEVAVSDTIGIAHPRQVGEVVAEVAGHIPLSQIALHFHDTRGMALANVMAGLDLGVQTYDAAAGGLGGCPYAPGATGNLATEDLLYLLDGLGITTGVDLSRLLEASAFIESRIGHALPSRVYRASRAR
ncbi:MAG: hydroxymethylglutaryl-CoA lyase [Acidobacteria bacterium]|nr:hydroxymethylglutaryl-CoA lyase [Acidobacteriota bacterium]